MRVECTQCKKTYNIPDERLPQRDEIAFLCPACKEVIKLDLRSIHERSAGGLDKQDGGDSCRTSAGRSKGCKLIKGAIKGAGKGVYSKGFKRGRW